MNIIIFGATSKTGLHVVEHALDAGHMITAFVRTPSKLTQAHDHLRVVQGDALDADAVIQAMPGHDAVISLLGPSKNGPKALCEQSTRYIIEAMKENDVARIVVASVGGVPVEKDNLKGMAKLITGVLKLILRDMFKDRQAQLELLEKSGLRWTALRLPRLTDDPRTGDVELGYMDFSPKMAVSRADVAAVMLAMVEQDDWVGEAPKITNTL